MVVLQFRVASVPRKTIEFFFILSYKSFSTGTTNETPKSGETPRSGDIQVWVF